jgi:hypothetical protein
MRTFEDDDAQFAGRHAPAPRRASLGRLGREEGIEKVYVLGMPAFRALGEHGEASGACAREDLQAVHLARRAQQHDERARGKHVVCMQRHEERLAAAAAARRERRARESR